MFGLVMPVGPGARELSRMHDTLEMVRAHERPENMHLFLIDDDPQPRGLDPRWPNQTVLRTELRRRRHPDAQSAMTAATITGLRACREHGVDMAIKLDTDVAVIRPFSASLQRAFTDERLGVVGSYDRTMAGGIRDWTVWEDPVARADRRWIVTRRPDGRRMLWHKRPRHRGQVRRLRTEAARCVPVGAHCLGGAYAVSPQFLSRAELDWEPWVGTHVSEDVVVGILCAAIGLTMRSLVAPGDPFALAWRGLPASPEEIRARKHSIVHSVKAETLDEERRLRAKLAGADEPPTNPRCSEVQTGGMPGTGQ